MWVKELIQLFEAMGMEGMTWRSLSEKSVAGTKYMPRFLSLPLLVELMSWLYW